MNLRTPSPLARWALLFGGTAVFACSGSKEYEGSDHDPSSTTGDAGLGGSENVGGTGGSAGSTSDGVTLTSGGASSGGSETSGGDSGMGGDPGSGGDAVAGGAGGSGGNTATSSGGSEATGSGGSEASSVGGTTGTDSGGSSGSTSSGGAGTTTGSSSSSTSSGGTSGTSGEPELGAPCDDPGELACNGAAQKLQLICESGSWETYDTCESDENCDQADGICAPIDENCEGLSTGDRYCDDNTVRECGPDQVNSEAVDDCTAACRIYEGQGRCVTVTQVAAGRHTCAVLSTGQLRCWGGNTSGELGYGHERNLGDEPYEMPPPDVPLGEPVKYVAVGVVAAGGSHTCAVLESGNVRCWGQNQQGQLGLGHTESIGDDELPTNDVPLGEPAKQVALGEWHSCALLESGVVKCWGNTLLAPDTDPDPGELYLEEIPLESNAVQIASHGSHVCALLEGGAGPMLGRELLGRNGDAARPLRSVAWAQPRDRFGRGRYPHWSRARNELCRGWGSRAGALLGRWARLQVGYRRR